jgi:6-phosphofructokinase 1
MQLDPDQPATLDTATLELNRQNTRTIDRTGGTFLHTSRLDPSRLPLERVPEFVTRRGDLTRPSADQGLLDCTPHVLRVIEWLGLDDIVVIGGDATLGYANRLASESVPIVGVPKTMDNDVFGTDYCLGFSTAVSRSIQFIHQIRSSAGSHERVAVVELFGQQCGETTLLASYLAGADRALIPEVPFHSDRVAELVSTDRRLNPSNYAVVTISEGARAVEDPAVDGSTAMNGGSRLLVDALGKLTGEDVLYQQVGYLMRSGAPDGLDLMVADNFAVMALSLIDGGEQQHMVSLQRGVYTSVPISTISTGRKRVDVPELYDPAQYLPVVSHVRGKPMFLY